MLDGRLKACGTNEEPYRPRITWHIGRVISLHSAAVWMSISGSMLLISGLHENQTMSDDHRLGAFKTGVPSILWPKASKLGQSHCASSGRGPSNINCCNCRTSGGDKVETFLSGPGDAVLPVAVKDLGNGCYLLSCTANRPGTWTIKARVRTWQL